MDPTQDQSQPAGSPRQEVPVDQEGALGPQVGVGSDRYGGRAEAPGDEHAVPSQAGDAQLAVGNAAALKT